MACKSSLRSGNREWQPPPLNRNEKYVHSLFPLHYIVRTVNGLRIHPSPISRISIAVLTSKDNTVSWLVDIMLRLSYWGYDTGQYDRLLRQGTRRPSPPGNPSADNLRYHYLECLSDRDRLPQGQSEIDTCHHLRTDTNLDTISHATSALWWMLTPVFQEKGMLNSEISFGGKVIWFRIPFWEVLWGF